MYIPPLNVKPPLPPEVTTINWWLVTPIIIIGLIIIARLLEVKKQ